MHGPKNKIYRRCSAF